VSGVHGPLTLASRIGPGPVLRHGTSSAYRSLELVDGERHVLRADLVDRVDRSRTGTGRPVICFAHLTDLQLADVQSPARFEFFNREYLDPRYAELVPTQRPHEALTAHAVDAMVRAVNELAAGPVTGAPLDLVVTTGDSIDNAQWNELQAVLALLDGGTVRPGSGGTGYRGVQGVDWPDDIFWRPDPHSGPRDVFRSAFGFPEHPGLLEAALASFRAGGLQVPWLACYGNHEALIQGVGLVTPELAAAMVGDRKPARLPRGFDHGDPFEVFVRGAHVFLDGHPQPVQADVDRRPLSRREFVEAHLHGGRPVGHGFTERNVRDGTAYYVHDAGRVRFVTLDTACQAGAAAGSLDRTQLHWLADRLAEVHASYFAPDGTQVRTDSPDRLVVLLSHHGSAELTNVRPAPSAPDGRPVAGGAEVLALLHRFPNVVLWVSGHTHTNAVVARPDPARPGAGLWEVTTSAVVDWPCQARLLELVDEGDGTLSVVCTMIDHDGPVSPPGGWPAPLYLSGPMLAGLHRELAANVPLAGPESGLAGAPTDRNVVLRVRAPFAQTT
jgi:metallophosphoesterase (TIGR03767 family)